VNRAAVRSEPRPRKELGQHFLRDTGILRDIAEAVRPPADGFVLEIGAGTGELTAELLRRHGAVVAVELEHRLVRYLRRRFADERLFRVIEGDARTVDLAAELGPTARFAAVGNLPYYAANPILRHLLEGKPQPTEIVAMLQREVAREIAAPPGKRSLLALSIEVYAEAEYLFSVPPEAFDPPPKVWSGVVRLRVRPEPLVPEERREAFFELVAKTFRNPRKQIHNALAQGVWLPKGGAREALEAAGIDPMRRPETLALGEWLTLLDAVEAVRAHA
jgi:16S rRNA (adenine1518-N6/adenine1519-N6)-dimethyltransferase